MTMFFTERSQGTRNQAQAMLQSAHPSIIQCNPKVLRKRASRPPWSSKTTNHLKRHSLKKPWTKINEDRTLKLKRMEREIEEARNNSRSIFEAEVFESCHFSSCQN